MNLSCFNCRYCYVNNFDGTFYCFGGMHPNDIPNINLESNQITPQLDSKYANKCSFYNRGQKLNIYYDAALPENKFSIIVNIYNMYIKHIVRKY